MVGARHVHAEWAVQVPNTKCQRAKGEVFVVLKCYYKICHFFHVAKQKKISTAFRLDRTKQIYSLPTNFLTHLGTEAQAFQNSKLEFYIKNFI